MPKTLLNEDDDGDLSPLDLALDVNELVNMASENSDSIGKQTDRMLKLVIVFRAL